MTLKEIVKELNDKGKVESKMFSNLTSWSFTNVLDELPANKPIEFVNCLFKEDFRIVNLKDEGIHMIFTRCTFEKKTFINRFELYELTFENCSFLEITIMNSKIDEIDLKDCIFQNMLSIDSIECTLFTVSCEEHSIINNVFITSKLLKNFVLDGAYEIQRFLVRSAHKIAISSNVKRLEIDATEFESIVCTDSISSSQLSIDQLLIVDLNFTGNILFENAVIKDLVFSNVTCADGSIRFNELEIDQALFENVDIASFFWNQVSFDKGLVIERCNFNVLNYANVNWLKGKKLSDSFLDEKVPVLYGLVKHIIGDNQKYNRTHLISLRYERESYKQLKAAATANHNHIEALDFYRNEMRLYWKEVRINGGIPWTDRLLIFMNRWSSDFGQNWILPIIGLGVFHLIWFSCLFNWNYWKNKLSGGQEFAQFAKLLNPTHDNPEYVTTGTGYLTDIIMRISIGYFVYHLIKATRKYGKI